MNIAVIGTGKVGSTLGKQWADIGHRVVFGSRRAETSTWDHLLVNDNLSVALPDNAAQQAEVVVLATPWSATESAIKTLGDLRGKILIDCTNPLGPGLSFQGKPGASGGEQVAGWAKGAKVVKAFNTTGAKNMAMPEIGGQPLAMFICGDDAQAKKIAARLAVEIGFAVIDNGPLSHAHYLEAMAMVWITQAFSQGWGPDFGIAVLHRS